MKNSDVTVGATYIAKVSGKLTHVKLIDESLYGGWNGINLKTGMKVRIRSAQKLRREVKPDPSGQPNTYI